MTKTKIGMKRSRTSKAVNQKLGIVMNVILTGKVLTRKLWVLVIAALLVVSPLPAPRVRAATINVTSTDDVIADDGQCTLREAIRNANDTTDGQADNDDCASGNPSGADTIVLGTNLVYTLSLDTVAGNENDSREDDLDVKSEITIQGNGSTIQRDEDFECDLDGTTGQYEFRIFDVTPTGKLTLQNVTLENGCADGNWANDSGGGIFVSNGRQLTLQNSSISRNIAYFSGGGIYNYNGTVVMTNSTITNNLGDDNGGGIFNDTAGSLAITNSTIQFNEADYGGGIYNQGGVTITGGTTIFDNKAFNDGGGILNEKMLTITGSTIKDNSADEDGGGISNSSNGTVTITNSTISENNADGDGGAIKNSGSVTITGTMITQNRTEDGDGGAIFNRDEVEITNSTLSNNTAFGNGGAIANNEGAVEIMGSTIKDNSAQNDGGGIFNYLDNLDITSSTISNNEADRDGGAIANDSGEVEIRGSTLLGNHADKNNDNDGSGGAISNGNGGRVLIIESTISSNTAYDGGGIFNFDYTPTQSQITINSSTISLNQAKGNAGGLGNGGLMTLTNSTISGNQADGNAGGIYNESRGNINVSFVTIAKNNAVEGGGIWINITSGTFNIKNSIVGDNTASQTGPNCRIVNGTFSPFGDNLATDGSCLGFTQVASTGAGGLNLGLLQNNGGPTNTHALGSGSAALDAVTDCTDLQSPTPQPVTDDQRGVSRPQGVVCDVGAYEAAQFTLTVAGAGTGSGTVTGAINSSQVINCSVSAGNTSGDCTESTVQGENPQVTLTATPGANSTFVGWSGCSSSANSTIMITLNADKTCKATFGLGGTIVIRKEAIGGDGTFSFSGPNSGSFSITTSSGTGSRTFSLAPGSYTVTETTLPSGWNFSTLVCQVTSGTGSTTSVNLAQRKATITLAAGETVTCTFTNTRLGVSLFRLQQGTNCLTLDLTARTYVWRTASRTFSGAIKFTQTANAISFRSVWGANPLLKGTINLRQRGGSAALVVPLSRGGGAFTLSDSNIDDNGPCPP